MTHNANLDMMISTQATAFGFGNPSEKVAEFERFLQAFQVWIQSSEQAVLGLPKKRTPHVVSGITDAFNQLYGMYNKIGVHDGEYMYHQNVLKEERITTNLEEADKLGIPIFIDCAFFGICHGIDFNFKPYNNIHSVCFSLSKTFGTGLNRVGLLYTKDNFPCKVYKEWGYPLIASAEHHYRKIKEIGPDDLPKKYLQRQIRVCRKLGLIPSPTVIFGLSYDPRYTRFKRGSTNRVCITRRLEYYDEQ